MALQLDFTTDSNINISNAYVIISSIRLNKIDKRAYIDVNFYQSKEDRLNNVKPIVIRNFTINDLYVPNSTIPQATEETYDKYFDIVEISKADTNSLKQAYKYLKTLNQFKDAIDV